ncbi:relaxin-3 receptor 1 [Syngnathoides biaculeatus]|uniref:relaxin-3 receptor 1 n=1 Tax=Syngnathoides biaculeatus TaxID=300417 RepID=UPI002ADD8300|nr:relaxin-3 receptor 1 [Syngnathoides biaculeatus]
MSGESVEEGSGWSSNGSANATPAANRSCDPELRAAEAGSDGAAAVRIVISAVYALVCALGLVGNLLVLYLMKSKRAWKKSPINLFVTSLALTDFQFVLTLPFWAVENALDFTWLFGRLMCKTVSYVTAMNMYASVFFLTAMSVARYTSLASALHGRRRRRRGGGGPRRPLPVPRCGAARCVAASIWLAAACAALPHAVFSTTVRVSGEEDLCLVKFPESEGASAQLWLGLYHAQKVLLGFVAPLAIITACYLLLLRFVAAGDDANAPSAKRRAKVTKSVTIVVLSFFLCWLPNQALTAWGILIKLNVVHFTYEYYTTQVYVFPVSVCLAHSNSCLNPVLYCLMRREFRKALKKLFRRIASPAFATVIRPIARSTKPEADERGRVGHARPSPRGAPPQGPAAVLFCPPGAAT